MVAHPYPILPVSILYQLAYRLYTSHAIQPASDAKYSKGITCMAWPHADIICQVQLDQRCYLLTEAAGKFFYFAQLQLERHPEETTDTQIPDHQL